MSSAIATQELPLHSILPTTAPTNLLIISPNDELRSHLLFRLSSQRWEVQSVSSGAEALERMDTDEISLVLLDPSLPDLKVDEFKEILQFQHPEIEVIPVNPHTGQAIMAAPSPNSLSFEVVRELEATGGFKAKQTAITSGDSEKKTENGLPGFVGKTASVQQLCAMVRLVAQRDTTVLITGESGTGKDLVACALHQLSGRRLKPFVVINCAAIPEALLEAELFGFVKGAFTGAVQSRIGRIHAAQGGTLFLDEIGDLPIGLQSKLLRFLEQGEVQRLGSTDTFRVDVRVIAATNANLRRQVQEHNFREDLYYRLSVFPIELPPLRQRMEDVPSLAQTFIAKFCPHNVVLTPEALSVLQQHSWPGNVREVRNVIERATILAGQDREIRPEHILI
ncbi:MAG TPA: sigma-54 dependent transcriptional regulator [Terriglobales bacterium]|jgi:transcriptional regulator with GAF, ATPase, and Fis domain